jgi:hypothetical protein
VDAVIVSGGYAACLSLYLAFAKIQFGTAGATHMVTVHFVRKNLFFLSACVAFTHERFKVFIRLVPGAMLR